MGRAVPAWFARFPGSIVFSVSLTCEPGQPDLPGQLFVCFVHVKAFLAEISRLAGMTSHLML